MSRSRRARNRERTKHKRRLRRVAARPPDHDLLVDVRPPLAHRHRSLAFWRRPLTSSTGLLGIGVLLGGTLLLNVSMIAAAAVGIVWGALAIHESRRQSSAVARLCETFALAEFTPLLEPGAHSIDERFRGRVDGHEIEIVTASDHVVIATSMPADVTIVPGRATTPCGDPAFDQMYRVEVTPVTRLALTAAIRTQLVALAPVEVGGGTLRARVWDSQATAARLEAIVRGAIEVATAFATAAADREPTAALLAAIPHEPHAAVRRAHFEWLHAQGEPGAALVARSDRDPEIREWAGSHAAPADDVYR